MTEQKRKKREEKPQVPAKLLNAKRVGIEDNKGKIAELEEKMKDPNIPEGEKIKMEGKIKKLQETPRLWVDFNCELIGEKKKPFVQGRWTVWYKSEKGFEIAQSQLNQMKPDYSKCSFEDLFVEGNRTDLTTYFLALPMECQLEVNVVSNDQGEERIYYQVRNISLGSKTVQTIEEVPFKFSPPKGVKKKENDLPF